TGTGPTATYRWGGSRRRWAGSSSAGSYRRAPRFRPAPARRRPGRPIRPSGGRAPPRSRPAPHTPVTLFHGAPMAQQTMDQLETAERTLVRYEKQDGIAIFTLDDPPANTYTHEMMRQLDEAILRAR